MLLIRISPTINKREHISSWWTAKHAGEGSWRSSKEERKNQERNRLEVAKPETPLTSALARITIKTEEPLPG